MTVELDIPPVPALPTTQPRPVRVALLTNENTPYRIPLYRELAATPGWQFHVFTCIDREFDRLWEIADNVGFPTSKSYSWKYTRRRPLSIDHDCVFDKEVHIPIGVVSDVLRYRPDVVISNEFGARTLLASLTAKIARHKLIVYSESTYHTEHEAGMAQKTLRRILRSRPDAFTCNGRDAREYLESLGVARSKIFEIGQALDIETFESDNDPTARAEFRDKWNVSGLAYLYVGQLIKFKGLDHLIRAWKEFSADSYFEATLLLAGEGHDRAYLESEVVRLGLTNVRFLGFVARNELSAVCAAADVFVFPTLKDCFSLAFEEAMAAGLPVIGSIYGGESELVEEGTNGWVCDPLNHADLVAKLRLAWNSRDELPGMGEHARVSVSRMAIDKVADRIRHAVDFVLNDKAPSARGAE